MIPPLHGKVITTVSYYDGVLASEKQEMEVSLLSTRETILKDLIDALTHINSGETRKLDLCIMVDIKGRYRIIKKWNME